MGRWLRHYPVDVGLTASATTQECTQIGGNGLSAPFWGTCVHCCDASFATRVASGGTSIPTTMACRRRPLAGPSRLVGKTDSERVAPLPGWHLRQGVNPHEPLKSQKWDLFKAERTVASTLARLHEHMEFHRFNPNATEICIFLCHDQVPVQ